MELCPPQKQIISNQSSTTSQANKVSHWRLLVLPEVSK
jgi:hypothetical protein